MSSRKTHSKTANAVLEGIALQLLQSLAALSNTPCPTCGQRTLTVEYTQRSGITVHCTGLDQSASDPEANACNFCRIEIFTTENELPNVTLAPEIKVDEPKSV